MHINIGAFHAPYNPRAPTQQPRRACLIFTRAINRCWFCFKWIVIPLLVAGAVSVPFLYRRVNEEIRCHVVKMLSSHYSGLKVKLRSAEIVEGEGIRIRDLTIVDPSATDPSAELLRIDEAMFECSTDWRELLSGKTSVNRITINRPALRAVWLPDGTCIAGKLFPPPHFSDHPPPIVVRGGVVELIDPGKQPISQYTLRDVNLTLGAPEGPLEKDKSGATAGLTGSAGGISRKNTAGQASSGTLSKQTTKGTGGRRLLGTLSGDGLRRVTIEGTIGSNSSSCSLAGKAEGLNVSPEMRGSLPGLLSKRFASLRNLRGEAELQFELSYDPKAVLPLKYMVSGRLARGRIDDARLPHALTEISADVRVDNGGVTIDGLAARIGQATLRMSCRRNGFSDDSPMNLTAQLRGLELDRALLDILPMSLQEQWHKFLPAGRIDADVKLDFDGLHWRPDISARYLNVSLTHHKFPYRLEHGKGTVELHDDLLKVNLIAYSGSRPVRLTAEMADAFTAPVGWFEAKGDDIQLDEALISALPEKPRKVVRSLDPRGSVNFFMRMWRNKPSERMHKHLILAANRCTIRFDKFPYPLTNIRGTMEMLDDNWTFRNFEANNDTARVTCQGQFTEGLQGKELSLKFVGRDVPLEEELRDALNPSFRQVWNDMQPRGTVDLTADVRYLAETKKFSVAVHVEPQPNSTSVEPVRFPYRLERLEGALEYRDGRVTFDRCKAEHGAAKLAGRGWCEFQPDGRWHTRFDDLTIDRLAVDRELLQAMPPRLKKATTALNPTGPINLRGSFDMWRNGSPPEPLDMQWNVRLGLQQAGMHCGGIELQNICGEVSLNGGFRDNRIRSIGELALDSVSYKDYQLTEVRGPIWIEDQRVLLGSWVDRHEGAGTGRTPRPISGKMFGGTLFGNGWAMLEAEPRYGVNATLVDADLARCAREVMAGRQRMRGKITATADITGRGWTRNSLSGKGTIRLSNADVYELPVMISLLKILSIRPPDQNAFSDGNVAYRIEGEHIYFDQINFRGDAISLRGKGEMDFQSAIKLTFYTLVGRGELDIPIVKDVFRGASQQLMQIHVTGTLQNPETRKEALPIVSQALQQLAEELRR